DRMKVDHVVHLWTYGGDSTTCTSSRELAARQYAGTYSVVYLAQILDTVHSARPVSFILGPSQAQATCEKDLVACEKATLLGLLKTISFELPLLDCRHVDLEGNSVPTDPQRLAQDLAIPQTQLQAAY